ncbi:MAG: ROK family protein, partial [Terrimesophilobacter sp.]
GISKSSEEFLPLLKLRSPIKPAQLRNNAGIVGAAELSTKG